MEFEDTISIIQELQRLFTGQVIKIECPTSIIKDDDIQILASELKESGIKGGNILRIDDIRKAEEKKKREEFLEKYIDRFCQRR